jgi:hypothetical protein
MARTVDEILEGSGYTREMLTPEFLESIFGTPEESAALMRVFEKNSILAEQAMAADFPGEYVAVFQCKVVAHSPCREDIFTELERLDLLGEEGLAIARPGS